MFEILFFHIAHTVGIDHSPRYPDHRRIDRHFFDHYRVRADLAVVANLERTEHLSPGTDHHIIAQSGMTLILGPGGTAQSDAMVEGTTVADLRGLTDHHTHAMINKKTATDAGAGVDFDAGEKPSDMGDQPAQKEPLAQP